MDINLLVVGVGNSRLHVGAFVSGELKHVRHFPVHTPGDWPEMLRGVWAELSEQRDADVVGASVVPDLNDRVEHAVQEATGKSIQWVGSDIDLPIPLATAEPKKTGVDRALVTAAAYEQLGKACVVVDAGTAVTINLCNNSGTLVGGAIAPGATTMLRSLHEKTARLPNIAYEAPTTDYGADTIDAMRHGVTHAIRGLVQTMAERWAEQQGVWPEVIATGGDAHALFDGWEVVHAVSPDLLLYGIALAYANHHIKHGT